MVSSLAERFRRAVLSDDLASAKAIAQRAGTETCNDAQPFDIRNQTILRSGQAHHSSYPSAAANACGSDNATIHITCNAKLLPALSASQHQQARQSRNREKSRQSGHSKSSLALAIESGASIELIQWLLDMGHERDHHTLDFQNCTMVALAALHNRADVIEALCIDAVASAASLHHEKSVTFGSGYRKRNLYENDEEEEEEEGEGEDEDEDEGEGEVKGEGMESMQPLETSLISDNDKNTLRIESTDEGIDWTITKDKVLPTIPFVAYTRDKDVDNSSEMDATRASSDSEEDVVHKEVMQLLNTPDELGRTPLALTSIKGHQEVVNILLDLGADIDLPDYEGNTPIHYAASYNHLVIVQILIERGCSFAIKNSFDFTASDYAYTTTLKSALEAFARAKSEKDRKSIQDEQHQQLSISSNHKLKSSLISSAKAMQASLQLRLNH